ncbi:MAG: aminoglycoside phosphotransferase family protein [Actinobacteria bacterium]|nr:aminoglycoside phosphotransferase family protein [Actinomycetota bacterium]
MDERTVEAVARRFHGPAEIDLERHERGHIHDTWFVSTSAQGSVLQRLNDHVFADCVLMMDNVLRVTGHLQRRLQGVPSVLRATDGTVLVYDADGRPWRAFERVPHASSHRVASTPAEAWHVGKALGRFLAAVQDLPGRPPEEPIPGFKDFERRRADFEMMVEADIVGRVATCADEIEAVRRHHGLVERLSAARAAGDLPTRLVHNDAKAENVLLDDDTGEAVCVIDLDTVARGTVLFDVGDLLRSATVTATEDAGDLAALAVRDDLLRAAVEGYVVEAEALLTPEERALIPLAGPLMAYESALRFLTDHLAGDAYFRVSRPRHNLDRARAQLRVLEALDSARARVAELVAGVAGA